MDFALIKVRDTLRADATLARIFASPNGPQIHALESQFVVDGAPTPSLLVWPWRSRHAGQVGSVEVTREINVSVRAVRGSVEILDNYAPGISTLMHHIAITLLGNENLYHDVVMGGQSERKQTSRRMSINDLTVESALDSKSNAEVVMHTITCVYPVLIDPASGYIWNLIQEQLVP